LKECNAQNALNQKKVDMERQNKTFIGDINQFAFLKPDQKASAAATSKTGGVKSGKLITKPEINTKYDWY
jgi:hypothetical protein